MRRATASVRRVRRGRGRLAANHCFSHPILHPNGPFWVIKGQPKTAKKVLKRKPACPTHISTCVPSSTTDPGGSRKKDVASRACRAIHAKSASRQPELRARIDSRPRKKL